MDALAALNAWFQVRSAFWDWDRRRTGRLWLDEIEEKFPDLLPRLTPEDLRAGDGRPRARMQFDEAIKKCANKHGPLGIGDSIEKQMIAIDDLRIWLNPGVPAGFLYAAQGRGLDDRRLGEGLAKMEQAIERVDRTISQGWVSGQVIECPILYVALASALHYARIVGLRYTLCVQCRCPFVAERSDAKTCSPRCRKALARRRQKAKKPTR